MVCFVDRYHPGQDHADGNQHEADRQGNRVIGQTLKIKAGQEHQDQRHGKAGHCPARLFRHVEFFFKGCDDDQVAMQVLQGVQLFPGAMNQNRIAGLKWTIRQLAVIGVAGLMDGQWIQTKGFTETDLFDRLANEAGPWRDHALYDAGQ